MNITMVLGIDFEKPYVDGRVHREARSLVRAGHNVTIVCWARTITNENLTDLPAESKYDGIKIKRVFSPISPVDSSKFTRIRQHLKAMKKIAEVVVETPTDALHCHDYNTLFVTRYLDKFRKPLVYDSHEDFINMLDDVLPWYMLGIARGQERKLISNHVNYAITIAEPVAETLREYGADKTVLVMNCRELDDYDGISSKKIIDLKNKYIKDDELMVLYLGVIGRDRGLKDLVEVFRRGIKDNIKLVIGGMGHLENELRGCVKDVKSASWVGFVPGKKLIEYNLASDIMLVLFNPARPSQARTLPNKLFEAMAAAKPIIVCEGTEAAKIVEKEKCGLTIPYGNTKALADAIVKLADDPALRTKLGKAGRAAAEREYNWKLQEKRLLDIYEEINKNNNN
jgi:glycosyltransferase involved in cell wall biosynthesis